VLQSHTCPPAHIEVVECQQSEDEHDFHEVLDGNKSLYSVFVGRAVFSTSWTVFRSARTVAS
jgi:hypothetical protein